MEKQAYLTPESISDADWENTPESVRRFLAVLLERIEQQEKQLKAQQTEIDWLKEQLHLNSSNSSKPPSSDVEKRQPPKREKSGKQRGGQPDHGFQFRKLYPVEACKSVADYYPTTCWKCGAAIEQEDGEVLRHQVVDIPPVEPEVIEHRLHQCICLQCHCLTRATLPDSVSRKGYGPGVVARIGVLRGMYRLSQRLVREAMSDLFGIELSLGSINNLQRECSEALEIPVSAAHDYVQQQAVVGADETGFAQGNVDGLNPEGRKAWVWVAVTPFVTFFLVTLSRSQESAQALLGKAFSGILISDRHSGYTWVNLIQRQLCWAHLKRDFIRISERSGVSKVLGEALLTQQKKLFELWYRVRDGTLSRDEFVVLVQPLRSRVKELLEEGAAYPIAAKDQSPLAKTVRTCRRLLKLEPALWVFVATPGVEPTNNDSERALRPAVIWRRISFGSQTEAGSIFVSRMLTVVTTLRSQKRNVVEFMTQACHAAREETPPPSLLPQIYTEPEQSVAAV